MKLSVVSPFFNEEESIAQFLIELYKQLNNLTIDFEVILVNDGSTDSSLSVIKNLGLKQMIVISLSKNSGHQTAIEVGYKYASGDWVITLDSDLQHPPTEILNMLNIAIEKKVDVVNAQRTNRDQDSKLKRVTALVFYKFIKKISKIEVEKNVADFRLISRKVVEVLNSLEEPKVFRLLIPRLGFTTVNHPFEVNPRFGGKPKYSIKKMLGLAADSAFSFGTLPLRAISILGLITVSLSISYFSWIFYLYATGKANTGWPSIMGAVLLLGGVQLISIGVIGEYIGRIFIELKKRPRYNVSEEFSSENSEKRTGIHNL